MDAIQLLTEQHRMLEQRLQQLLDTTDPQAQSDLRAQVGDHLAVHIASEEEVFYPAVKAHRTEDILLESLEEHLSLKRLLADLLEMTPSQQTYEPKLKVLREQTEHHHKEEEEHLFPKVTKLLNAAQREQLGQEMMALQQRMRRDGQPREVLAAQTDQAAPLV